MFLGMGRPVWKEARATLQNILSGFFSYSCFFRHNRSANFYKIDSFVIIHRILSRFFLKKVLVCSLQLFFWCCFAAAEPVLRNNKALRNKCLVPLVSFMSLPCYLFLQLATGSLIRSLMLCFDCAE
jgi:hypothetical protein